MKIYIAVDESGCVNGWSSTEGFCEGEVMLNIPDDHPFLSEHPMLYRYHEGSLVKSADLQMQKARKEKEAELSAACQSEILSRFTVTLDNVQYQFSNDMEAQLRFDKMDKAFDKGYAVFLPWTAYTLDGQVVRIILDAEKFEVVYLAHLNHIQNNISKFRDLLMPLVMEAETPEDIASIHWDMTFTP